MGPVELGRGVTAYATTPLFSLHEVRRRMGPTTLPGGTWYRSYHVRGVIAFPREPGYNCNHDDVCRPWGVERVSVVLRFKQVECSDTLLMGLSFDDGKSTWLAEREYACTKAGSALPRLATWKGKRERQRLGVSLLVQAPSSHVSGGAVPSGQSALSASRDS
ncbi:hypothetical protein R1flu_012919 [Riccia fluitans]|uniref:Uncharacterized protein n=1 Tax=Riccia fluitans TaxID=41844 RepID=A0ABD1ZG32_9MARC